MSRTVFIGNIPYGLSDNDITELFSSVGRIVNFRLVIDNETGRPKGYGFAEFSDADAAASAVRNMNGHQINGRELRVDWSHDGNKDGAGDSQSQQGNAAVGPLPPGADLPPGITCDDAISKTLATLPPPQLLDIVSQMKGLVMQEPARAIAVFREAPQLAYAIFQALLLMNLVTTTHLEQVIEKVQNPGVQPAQPQSQQGYGYGQPHLAATPMQPPYQSQAPPQQSASAASALGLSADQERQLRNLFAMPQEQLAALDPTSREEILSLKRLWGPKLGYV